MEKIILILLILSPIYAIALAVKMPKNAVAFAADTVTMLFGLGFYQIAGNRIKIARGR